MANKRLIDANVLIRDINADIYRTESEKSYDRCLVYRQPTVDAVEVVHGRWVEKQGGFWETATCSNCGEKYPTVGIIPRYCPNCGARMDKEDSP